MVAAISAWWCCCEEREEGRRREARDPSLLSPLSSPYHLSFCFLLSQCSQLLVQHLGAVFDHVAMSKTSEFWVGPVLGEGTFGRVFGGRHKTSGTIVAIKVLTEPSIAVHEQKQLRRLDGSDFVVSLWSSFYDEHAFYLVLECMAGDLSQIGTWEPRFAEGVLSAIESIHSKGVLHADIKPSNVLVSSEGRVKLTDFGSSVDLGSKSSRRVRWIGTTAFSSPEVIRGLDHLTVAADLWSYGCLLYAMRNGGKASPFDAETEALVCDRILWHQPSSAVAEKDGWDDVISNLLQPCPGGRLGAGDYQESPTAVRYESLRRLSVFQSIDISSEPSAPLEARTWSEDSLQDGDRGWEVFLA